MQARTPSKELGHISGRSIQQKGHLSGFNPKEWQALEKLGIGFRQGTLDEMVRLLASKTKNYGMDALQPDITTGSMAVPIQFLQEWLPGLVYVMTGARKIDEMVGISTVGRWEDAQVVQGVMERTGTSIPYGDYTNVPLSSYNMNYVYRTVVRFEEGMQVGVLEAAQSSRVNVDAAAAKRQSAALALEIIRNSIGFYGFNSGLNNTYGFLNDPGEGAYVTVANGASASPLWSTKTFLEICKDIRGAIVALRNQSQDLIDPESVKMTLGVATAAVDWLSTTSDFGISVRNWLKEAYPNIRVVSAPELNAANGGANVFYLFAEQVMDDSTDNGRVFDQLVQNKFMTLGVQQKPKAYEEDYSNAMAGVMCKRPWAMVRRSGI